MPSRAHLIVLLSVMCLAGTAGAPGTGTAASAVARASARASTTGVIEGTVRVDIGVEADPPMLSPYARRRYRPPSPSAPRPGSPTNVVVYVILDEAARASAPVPAPAEAVIEQRNRAIVPHVTPIQRGATVQFPNRDDVFHNLFSLSDTHPFNLGRYPPGESRSETFQSAGVLRMFCDIHSEMGGTILVLDTWLFARPDAEGAYRIVGVPPGRHRIVAWHDASIADTAIVAVSTNAGVRVDFELSS